MIKLEKTFVSGDGGFSNDPLTYTLVERTESAAVYERSRQGMIKDYEVFKIRVLEKGKKIFTKIVQEDTEQYPSSEQFGKTGATAVQQRRRRRLNASRNCAKRLM